MGALTDCRKFNKKQAVKWIKEISINKYYEGSY